MTTSTVTAPTRIGLLATPLIPLRFLMARGDSREGVRFLRFSKTGLRLLRLFESLRCRYLGPPRSPDPVRSRFRRSAVTSLRSRDARDRHLRSMSPLHPLKV